MPVTTEVPERANPKTTIVRGMLSECSMGNVPLAALIFNSPQDQLTIAQIEKHEIVTRRNSFYRPKDDPVPTTQMVVPQSCGLARLTFGFMILVLCSLMEI